MLESKQEVTKLSLVKNGGQSALLIQSPQLSESCISQKEALAFTPFATLRRLSVLSDQEHLCSGPSCSKQTMWLVNVSLKL